MTRRRRSIAAIAAIVVLGTVLAFGLREPGEPVRVVIPPGATLPEVADSLAARDVIGSPLLFRAYVRARQADRKLKAGAYDLRTGSSWHAALRQLTRGEVVTTPLTIPEGYQLTQMAARIAEVVEVPEADVLEALRAPDLAVQLDVPGPSLEGYLFPDTYRFARGVPVSDVIAAMAERYRAVWTPARLSRLAETGMSEAEVVTLASIVQAEARHESEMPRIAGVYHNRLAAGWLLQADPTVLYALGGYRERLLYAAIDSVEGHPYNTYSTPGLPPGPIGSPGELAIDAALAPEDHDFMYFVAWPDGSHVFTRSLAEHNAAKENASRARAGERLGS